MTHVLRRPLLALLLLVVAIGGAQAATSAAPAKADHCFQLANWHCQYSGESVPAYVKRWFSAGTTLRQWISNEVRDAYGGSVYKCAGVKRQSDELITYIACGYGAPANSIGPAWRPGWVFIEQNANGARVITGEALH